MPKPAEKIANSSFLEEGEQIAAAVVTVTFGTDPGTTIAPGMSAAENLLIVGPLQKRLQRRLRKAGYQPPEDLDPGLAIDVAGAGVVIGVSDRRLLLVKDGGGDAYEELLDAAPIGDVDLVVQVTGKSIAKRRAIQVTFPDGRWLIRETMSELGPAKRATDDFVEAATQAGARVTT